MRVVVALVVLVGMLLSGCGMTEEPSSPGRTSAGTIPHEGGPTTHVAFPKTTPSALPTSIVTASPVAGPPPLVIRAGATLIPAPIGGATWSASNGHLWHSTGYVPRPAAPPVVAGGSLLDFEFGDPAPDAFDVFLQEPHYDAQAVLLTPTKQLVVPLGPNQYTYLVVARWTAGQASYLFTIAVR